MSNYKRIKVLLTVMFMAVLTACGEEDEPAVPVPQDISTAYFDSCVSDKGWILVSSHEVKANGTLAKEDYWSAADAGKPQQYFFGGDTITTFLSTEAYGMDTYQVSRYTYNSTTHRLTTPAGEVFRVVTANPQEIGVMQYKGFNGNGQPIYIYSVYRNMNAGELAAYRRTHRYNIATINRDYPTLPEQMLITPSDFRLKVVNNAWKCAEAYPMETAVRYSAKDIRKAGSMSVPDNLYFTADSLVAFRMAVLSGLSVKGKQKYSFRANSFSLDTGTGTGLRILSLTADEMGLLLPAHTEGQQGSSTLYCIYHRMTAEELASSNGTAAADDTPGI